jgi:hypothetical protein
MLLNALCRHGRLLKKEQDLYSNTPEAATFLSRQIGKIYRVHDHAPSPLTWPSPG